MTDDPPHRKRIGFLSFGHWSGAPGSQTQSGGEALRQAVELAVAAEEIGIDGAFFRVHHYQRQHAAPFPLLAAIGTATSRIEIGTGVIDMRYENPLYMAEDAGAADLLAGERLQLGISRGFQYLHLVGALLTGRHRVSLERQGVLGEELACDHPEYEIGKQAHDAKRQDTGKSIGCLQE
ncbi:LLM class flavin-dependent oxidoreductase [bacterium]|nr:LLM class flavin-dependent oxidoreductase [bacterium]